MSRRGILAGLVVAAFIASLPATNASAAEVIWAKGDSWEYTWSAMDTGISGIPSMTGSVEMKVTKTTADSYILTLSGSATLSGMYQNMTAAGTATISGSITRAKVNFAASETTFKLNASVTSGLTFSMEFGSIATATPPINDLPINQVLTPGTNIWSNSTVAGTSWFVMPFLGNMSEPISGTEHLLLMVGENETVTTPAGTFDCVKLSAGFGPDAVTYYYSEKVGNYVKMSGMGGSDVGYSVLGNMTLKSYSYGKSKGIMSFVTGPHWWVTALVVALIAIVVVVGLIAMRRRGRIPQMVPPPMQQKPPPPPAG